MQPPLVATALVAALDLEDRIVATGELVARNHADIAAEVDGRVTQLLVEEGAAVEAGEALLELDPARRTLELDAARARVKERVAGLRNQQRETDRMRQLHGRGAASPSQLDAAETALRLAQSRVAASRAELGVAERAKDEATVRAPFAGRVVERKVSLGEYLKVGTPLVELVSLDPIEVVFRVAEVDSAAVAVGQDVVVRVASHPEERFAGTVDVVSPTIDPKTRTLRVKATLPNADGRLRPGLFARADLGTTQRKAVPVVPEEAVLQRAGGSYVFTMTPDLTVQRKRVRIAGFREGRIEIAEGLRGGETVVVRGHTDLIDGQRVRQPKAGPATVAASQTGDGEVAHP